MKLKLTVEEELLAYGHAGEGAREIGILWLVFSMLDRIVTNQLTFSWGLTNILGAIVTCVFGATLIWRDIDEFVLPTARSVHVCGNRPWAGEARRLEPRHPAARRSGRAEAQRSRSRPATTPLITAAQEPRSRSAR